MPICTIDKYKNAIDKDTVYGARSLVKIMFIYKGIIHRSIQKPI